MLHRYKRAFLQVSPQRLQLDNCREIQNPRFFPFQNLTVSVNHRHLNMHLHTLLLLLPALTASGILAAPVANIGMESRPLLPNPLPLTRNQIPCHKTSYPSVSPI